MQRTNYLSPHLQRDGRVAVAAQRTAETRSGFGDPHLACGGLQPLVLLQRSRPQVTSAHHPYCHRSQRRSFSPPAQECEEGVGFYPVFPFASTESKSPGHTWALSDWGEGAHLALIRWIQLASSSSSISMAVKLPCLRRGKSVHLVSLSSSSSSSSIITPGFTKGQQVFPK